MKSIFDSLVSGSAREKLGVLADVVSILGISVAAIIGGSLTLSSELNVENVLGVAAGAFVWFSIGCIIFAMFLITSEWLHKKTESNKAVRILSLSSLWAMLGALVIFASFIAYEIMTTIDFVQK